MENLLQYKQNLFDNLVDDITIDLRMRLTDEELSGLFRLTPRRNYTPGLKHDYPHPVSIQKQSTPILG
jgi:hypothetical protein